ncbi:MAG: hypothetical protein WA840_23530 [Caulobacteraceae bacterium]
MTLTVGSALSTLAAFQTQSSTTQGTGQSQQTDLAALLTELSPDANAAVLASTASTGSAASNSSDSLGQATSIADTAQTAAGSVVQLLQQLQQTATAATQPGLSSTDRTGLEADFQTLANQLNQTVDGASAAGVNLLDGSSVPSVQVTAGADGGKTSLSAFNLSLGGPVITVNADSSLATATSAATALSQVTSSLQSAGNALDTLSSQAKQITVHAAFVAQLGATLSLGTSAPDGADSVRLQALQLQQALTSQNGAIANAAPQSVLSLFRAS